MPLPARKVILLQYPLASDGFNGPLRLAGFDQAQKIREAANHHGVPVIDTYDALKNEPLYETYKWPHHSTRGNEVVSDLIARQIAVLAP